MNQRKNLLRFCGWFYLANTIFYWLIGWQYLRLIIRSGTLYGTYLANFSSPLGKFLVWLFIITSYLGHFALLAFLPCIILIPLTLLIPKRGFIVSLAIIIASIASLYLITDSYVFSLYRFHLNQTLLNMLFSREMADVFELSAYEVSSIILVGVLLIAIQCVTAALIWKWIIAPKRSGYGKPIAYTLIASLACSYMMLIFSIHSDLNIFAQQTPTLPYYNQILATLLPIPNAEHHLTQMSESHLTQPLFADAPLNYPLSPVQCKKPKKPKNILIIGIDTWRFDSVNPKLTPNIAKFAENNIQFKNHYSGGNATQPGLFSLFYALPPNYWSAMLNQKQGPVFFKTLLQQNYQVRIIWSSEMHVPAFDRTTFLGLKDLRIQGAPGPNIEAWDKYVTTSWLHFLKNRDQKRPFFTFLFYNAPHAYCRKQTFAKPFQPAAKHCVRFGLVGVQNPTLYINRYKNAVHYDDGLIGPVLASLKKNHLLKNTIVILTSDHGQEFNDTKQGYWGHTSNYSKYQVATPFIVHWPGMGKKVIAYRTSHYDLVPTLMQRALGCSSKASDYSIGHDLFQKGSRPFIIVAGYMNMGIVTEKEIIMLLSSGAIEVQDLLAKPKQGAKPDQSVIHQAMQLMRKFFK